MCKLKLCLGLLVLFIIVPIASAELVVTPSEVEKIISSQTSVSVQIKNTYNDTITVKIYSGDENVVPSTNSLTLSPNQTKTITLTLKPSNIKTTVVYVHDYGIATQSVTIKNANDYTIIVSPIDVDVETVGNETYIDVAVYNPTDKEVEITVESELDVYPDEFDVDPKEERHITIEAKLGNYEVKYNYDFGFKSGSVTQTIKVTRDEDVEKQIEEMSNEIKNLKLNLYLPDEVKVEVPNEVKVGKTFEAKVLGKIDNTWKPIERVPVGFEGVVKFTDSHGVVSFKPSEAGESKIVVFDRFGNVKVEKVVNVKKSWVNITVSNAEVGKKVVVNLPEPGKVIIYCDLEKVYERKIENSTLTYIPDKPGLYKIEFHGSNYEGAGTFTVKGHVNIYAYVNGKQIQVGQKIEPGSTVVIKFEYDNGMPVKDGYAYVDLPLTMYYPKEKAEEIFATGLMFSEGKAVPPCNIRMKMPINNGKITILIPKKANGGIINIEFKGDELASGSSIMLAIAEKPPAYEMAIPVLVAMALIGFTAVMYKGNYFGFATKLTALKNRLFRRDVDELI